MLSAVEDLEVLYLQVVADPHSDATREAFAAAVERTDPDRAQLIRLQLRMAQDRKNNADSYPAAMQAGDLIRAHGARWAEPVSQAVTGWQFLKGFVDLVTVDAEWFLEAGQEIYARAPVLHLDLTDAHLVKHELFASPSLERIVSLNLMRSDFGDPEARAIAESPYLRNLEWLDLSHNRIGDEGLDALAASANLPRLGYLNFRWNVADDPTPQHADEYDAAPLVGLALQEKYGPREWLDAHPRRHWPPERDAAWY
jgi:hypothetical protein